jgi:hypothetical protein
MSSFRMLRPWLPSYPEPLLSGEERDRWRLDWWDCCQLCHLRLLVHPHGPLRPGYGHFGTILVERLDHQALDTPNLTEGIDGLFV